MPEPYNYMIDLPKPSADTFLQDIMGIQQLKMGKQQAAIQQQQAQFAQQMQPLQLEAERARIAQIGQATAAGAEALKGSRLQNEQLQRQSDFQKELVDFASKPVEQWSEGEVRSLAAKGSAIDPARARGVLEFWTNQPKPEKNLVDDTAMKAGIAIAQNRPDVAKSIVDQAKSDAEKLGFTTASKFLDFGGFQLDQDPAYAYATILGHFGNDKAKLDQLVTASELKGKLSETGAKSELQQAQAGLAKVDADLKRLKAAGKLDAEEMMKQETARRENFLAQPFVRNYAVRRDAYNIITTADKTPIGDSAKVVAFIKLQDPPSVVSVTEKGQITSTTPIASLQSLVAKFNNDGLLGTTTRKDIDNQSKKIFESSKYDYDQFKKREIAIAKKYGLNPENIVSAFDIEEKPTSIPPVGPTGAPGVSISTGNLPVAPSYAPPAGVTIKSVR